MTEAKVEKENYSTPTSLKKRGQTFPCIIAMNILELFRCFLLLFYRMYFKSHIAE